MRATILLIAFAVTVTAAVGCSPKHSKNTSGKTAVDGEVAASEQAVTPDSSIAVTQLVQTYAWRDLMPSTDVGPKPLRLNLVWKATGPGRVIEPAVTVLVSGKPIEIKQRELREIRHSKARLAENATHEYQTQYEFADTSVDSIEMHWRDFHSGVMSKVPDISIHIVR